MNKILCYGFEGSKLWFGRPTFFSWLASYFHAGRFLVVKKIKGYEEYSYYTNHAIYVTPGRCYMTNDWKDENPLATIARNERFYNHREDFPTTPIHSAKEK